MRRAAVLAVLLAGAAAVPPVMAAGDDAPRLACRLEADPQPGPAGLKFTLCNEGKDAVSVLRWQTPLEGFLGDILVVERGGERVGYRGPMVKRAPPQRDAYVTLDAGQCQSVSLDLARGYDLRTPGAYTVRFQSGVQDVAPPGKTPRAMKKHKGVPLSCGPVTLQVP